MMKNLVWVVLISSTTICSQGNLKIGSPLDELPAHISRLSDFGQRADWSHDGKRVLFLEKTFGDVYEINIETKKYRPMTHHFFNEGYTRALYLANGDILLSGAKSFNSDDPWPSRDEENAELWILKADLSSPPIALNEHCSEGPAVSRKSGKIAWTFENAFYQADIIYEGSSPKLIDKKKILDAEDLPFECFLETQNFRPPDEEEILFSTYEYQNSEVFGLNIKSGEVVNYSNAPDWYDEPEGIFPSGKYILVECDKHKGEGIQFIDIYKLTLDGSGELERLTFFSNFKGYKATNPVISDDGKYMAFQVAHEGDPAGVGRGILIFDLEMYDNSK